jgi:hypothetical protein
LLGVFSEFERSIIRSRVKAGLARARIHGTKSGKPIGQQPLARYKVLVRPLEPPARSRWKSLTPTEFLDQISGSPRAARELIQRLSQRLREADVQSEIQWSTRNLAIFACTASTGGLTLIR